MKITDLNNENIKDSILLIDVDGTLVSDKEKVISTDVLSKLQSLSLKNDIFFCSNGSFEYSKELAKNLSAGFLKVKKPFTFKIKKILNTQKDFVVVGDKYLTDGLFALFLGAKFIKIDHLRSESDSFFIKFTYYLDDKVWNALPFIKSMRPWQWVKNFLIFAPIFFAGKFLETDYLYKTTIAFVSFCLVSGIIYIYNDISDVEKDSKHPDKKHRPIAQGLISKSEAYLHVFVLSILTIIGIYFVPTIFYGIFVYVLLNILYSKYLKHVAVVDIVLVASFYLLRVYIGGVATNTYISPWIVLCTFFGALFVIIGKRKSEYVHEHRREVLNQYSETALDFMLGISVSLAIIAYGIYSIVGHDNYTYLVYSTIFVLVALFRMLNRIYTHPNEAESPEILVFKDRYILGSFLCWIVYVFLVFYLTM